MKVYAISSALIILALASISWKGTLTTTDWRVPYLSELSSALLVGGLLSVLFRVFEGRDFEKLLRRLLRIHDSVDELGLVEILPESQAYNYTELLNTADHLSVVINDGNRWVGNNTVAIKNRLSRSGTTTEIFTVDPDSPFISALALKTGAEIDDLKRKIKDTWCRLSTIYDESEKKGTLKIYRLKTYPTKSVFLTEDSLIETPYQIASGRTNVPVFIYRKVARMDSPFSFVQRDIAALRLECVEHIPKTNNEA
jgi:hypothetical protein